MFASIRLIDAAARPDDNFQLLRHVAALLVIYGHSYAIANNPDGASDLFARLLPGFYAGSLAVHLFFAISGYLVTLSLLRTPRVVRYVRHRVLRVYPAYLACVLLCVFALGPAFTRLPASDYFLHADTWNHLQQNFIPVTFAWTLPGVFDANPLHAVNGTLWSLGLEVRWYFYLVVLALLTIVRRRWAFTLVAGAVLALGAWEWWSGKPDPFEYRALSQTFLLAALAAQWRDTIRVSHVGMLALVAAVALAHGTRGFGPLVMLAALYFTFWFAYRVPPLRWPKHRDWSYGLFLYGYPVQQILVALFPALPPLALCVCAIACALPLAMLSWRWIERPAMRWKRDVPPRTLAADPAP